MAQGSDPVKRDGNSKRTQFNDRKKMILKAVIDEYIRGGEPVGSKYLTQSANFNLSPATIRNEMSELERMGYLEQPHTSAGRVPSEEGYRYYVRSLMQSYRMTMDEIEELNRLTRAKMSELDRIIDSAGKLIGSLTNYTSLTFRRPDSLMTVMAFRTMKMNDHLFLLIMVMNADTAQTRNVTSSFTVTDEMLARLEDILNRYLAGTNMDTVTLPVIMAMEEEMGEGAPLIQAIVKCVYDAVKTGEGNLKFDGINRMLQYQEFSDVEKFRGFLGLVEEHKDQLIDVVSRADTDETNVFIGSEIPAQIDSSSALIFKNIIHDGRVIGAIGVIGPSRMDYSKVITTVDFLTRSIQHMVSNDGLLPPKLKGDDKDE